MGRVLVALVLGASSPAPASHASVPSSTLDLRLVEQVRWAEAGLGEGDATTVRITFWAPIRQGSERRELWQACRFAYGGAAVYRCGVDLSPGSPGRARRGKWMATVAIDGRVVALKAFRL